MRMPMLTWSMMKFGIQIMQNGLSQRVMKIFIMTPKCIIQM